MMIAHPQRVAAAIPRMVIIGMRRIVRAANARLVGFTIKTKENV
jgi:hypothetical protein